MVLGLVLGKPIGILGGSWLLTRFTRAELDEEFGWRDLAGVGIVGGVGFTVSLLVSDLSFTGAAAEQAKTAVLLASLIAGAGRGAFSGAATASTRTREDSVRRGRQNRRETTSHGTPRAPSTEEPTIGKLVVDASRDVSSLIQSEIALAKSELKVSVKAGGISIGLFAGAAFLGLLAIIMLSVAFAYFIAFTGLDLAWCFLIVFVVYVLIAALLGFVGVQKIKQVKAPERAIAQAKQIPSAFKRGS